MLKISKMADYATVIMARFAHEKSVCLSAAEVAERCQLSVPAVRKVLKLLQTAGLLSSERGVKGGYCLAQPVQAISLATVISAIDGPIALTECSHDDGLCQRAEQCAILPNWQWINQVVYQALNRVTIEQMIKPVTATISQTMPSQFKNIVITTQNN